MMGAVTPQIGERGGNRMNILYYSVQIPQEHERDWSMVALGSTPQ